MIFDLLAMRYGAKLHTLKGQFSRRWVQDRAHGFCHYPDLVHFESGKRYPGAADFTRNVVYGQPGAGEQGHNTLFHEGGHAADRLASEQEETCLNTEWPPASNAWAETHSQFMDTMFSSIEWRALREKQGRPPLSP